MLAEMDAFEFKTCERAALSANAGRKKSCTAAVQLCHVMSGIMRSTVYLVRANIRAAAAGEGGFRPAVQTQPTALPGI